MVSYMGREARLPRTCFPRGRSCLFRLTSSWTSVQRMTPWSLLLGDVRAGTLQLDQFSGMRSASSSSLWSTTVLLDGPAKGSWTCLNQGHAKLSTKPMRTCILGPCSRALWRNTASTPKSVPSAEALEQDGNGRLELGKREVPEMQPAIGWRSYPAVDLPILSSRRCCDGMNVSSWSAMESGLLALIVYQRGGKSEDKQVASSFVRMDGRNSGVRAETEREGAQICNIPLGSRPPVRKEVG